MTKVSATLSPSDLDRVEAGVRRLYSALGFPPPGPEARVTSLVQVLRALRSSRAFAGTEQLYVVADEVEGLSFRTAAAHLRAETGREFPPLPHPDRRRDGLLISWAEQGVLFAYILVRAGGPVERRRFSLAHELGHLILHVLAPAERGALPSLFVEGSSVNGVAVDDAEGELPGEEALPESSAPIAPADPHVEARIETGEPFPLPPIELLEQEADAFAARVLMPEEACRALAAVLAPRFGSSRDALARRMAPEFLVSGRRRWAAMQTRLEELAIGTPTAKPAPPRP